MMLLGVDWNGTRVRAVQGPLADFPLPLPLDPPHQDLPLILSLENRTPEIGLAGFRLSRRHPHLICQGFLPYVGEGGSVQRRWRFGPHDLDPRQALALVWERMEPVCRQAAGVVLGVPGYLSAVQADLMRELGEKARVPILGSLPLPLAGALAGYAEQFWLDSALVVDIDDHAMSLVQVRAVGGQAHVLDMVHLPRLGYHFWRERLLKALCDLCVLQSRRDPRGSAIAEQGLFEQLDGLLDACQKYRMIQLGIQASQWYQNLVIQPEQTVGFCSGLVRQAVQEIEDFRSRFSADEVPAVILVTHAVARLPGLLPALRNYFENNPVPLRAPGEKESPRTAVRPLTALYEDFGENLVKESSTEASSVIVLGPNAPVRAVHALGAHFQRGDLPPGHLELIAPLPLPHSVEAGPPRLHYLGQDYLLNDRNFFLGCQDGCHLLVDDPRHPHVAGRHCEIIFDRRTYILFNRSRDTTLVNDSPVSSSVVLHPGDWIRLGPGGPLLRFLGQPRNQGTHLTA